MQKTKTRLGTSDISFFLFFSLFSFDDKLGEFYNLQIIKFTVYIVNYTKMITVQKIKTRLKTSNIDFLDLEVILVLTIS